MSTTGLGDQMIFSNSLTIGGEVLLWYNQDYL